MSADNISFNALSLGLMPTYNLNADDYLAEVFSFSTVSTRYIRFDMSNCTQASFACAIGEAAFNNVDNVLVPEPSTLAIFALGMIGLASRRFKKQS
ncbi:PEP-CTERM sorting domain-containing protein [Colwellia sp. C1TZA3]|uniref:PEP-CTERM sorting domain-containing protein n=1 Tax=Colwellia sp. C1TZA3 TaxID=2508879 RepID=UPI0011B96611|nr:PEP-CTERM sorting domain-containing protein [Colwellia sp. C1TZA3]TWX66411.1 PEP-CTERM sorting domain-containing protein [Colwellia sp. C1TZA3]